MKFKASAVFLAVVIQCAPFVNNTNAAEVSSSHLAMLEQQLGKIGYTSVTVVLPQMSSAEGMKNPAAFANQTKEYAQIAIAELGSEISASGRYISPLGSMDLWVTSKGLEILRKSSNATAIFIGPDWHHKRGNVGFCAGSES
jgi:hypothetical protein